MDAPDAADVLAAATAYDNRTVTETAATFWSKALNPRMTRADAIQIVVDHYGRTRDWIMPADINTASDALRRGRLERMRTPEPPATLDADNTAAQLAWQRAYRSAIGDGHSEDEADEIADAAVGVSRQMIEAVRPVDALVDQAARSLPRIPARG